MFREIGPLQGPPFFWEGGSPLIVFRVRWGTRNVARPCVGTLKVVPDWRGQLTKNGSWTKQSKVAWRQKLLAFLGKSGVKAAEQQKKRGGLMVTKHANWYMICGLDQAISTVWGVGLRRFLPMRRVAPLPVGARRGFAAMDVLPDSVRDTSADRRKRAFIELADGTKTLECIWSGHRDLLVLNLDCGSVGWPSRGWLANVAGARVLRVLDPCHRHSNNVADAAIAAGLQVFRKEALALCNTNGGPWGEAANYQRWVESTLEYLDSTDSSDELFMAMYAWMSRDMHKGILPSEFGSQHHKDFVRAEIRRTVLRGKGVMVRMNRWFALWQQVRGVFGVWSIHLFCNVIMCIQRGIIKHIDELSAFGAHAGGAGSVSLSAGAFAQSSSAGQCRRQVKNGANDLDALRGKCANGMHLCTEILASRPSRSILIAMASVVWPVEQKHSLDITIMKTQMGRSQWNIDMACGRSGAYLLETLGTWTKQEVLVDMGIMSGSIYDQDMLLEPETANEVLSSVYAFWRHLVALEFCLVSFHTSNFPFVAFSQLSAHEEERKEGMAKMRRMWEMLEALEQAAHDDVELRGFATDLGWTTCQWSREVCISAAETEWTCLPRDILDQVMAVSRVASTSKLAEDAFNELRAQVEPIRNQKQGPHAVWQACTACTLCKDYDLDPVEIAPTNEVELSDVPQSIFFAKQREEQMSLPDAKAQFFDTSGNFAMSVQRYLMCPLASQALLQAPSVAALKSSWQSLIPVEGTLLWSPMHDIAGIVMLSSPHTVLLWKGSPKKVDDWACAFGHPRERMGKCVGSHTQNLPQRYAERDIACKEPGGAHP